MSNNNTIANNYSDEKKRDFVEINMRLKLWLCGFIAVFLLCDFNCYSRDASMIGGDINREYKKQVILSSNKPLSSQILHENTEYVIRRNLNLKGETIIIPIGCSLLFEKYGRFHNGRLVGNGTEINSSKDRIFKNIVFAGTFLSNKSRPEWFVGLEEEKKIGHCLDLFQGLILDGKYNLSTPIEIKKPVHISGHGLLSFNTELGTCFDIRSSSVSISGIGLRSPSIKSFIIHVNGNAQNMIKHISISQCRISGGKYAIAFDYCSNSSITYCTISDVERTAIGLYSSHNVVVKHNAISNINILHRETNSYGITATYHYGDPKSTDIIISNNLVCNNPYWEALDTHGGERIVFSGNIVKNCWRGVAAVGDDFRDIMLCSDIIIEDNEISCSDEPLSNGIVFTGVGADQLSENIKVLNNKVLYSVIALYSTNNDNVVIRDNYLFASDEIWRDVGSRSVLFERNYAELAEGNASFYEKTVFYFKPTVSLTNRIFGEINDNNIVTGGASVITYNKSFGFLNASVSENRNKISESLINSGE